VGRILKIIALAIGLTALGFLIFFGLAIWVFIPLLPAGIIYVVTVYFARRSAAVRKEPTTEAEVEHRKAA
jgi:hypothetical protein